MKKTARILIIFVIICFVFAFVGCSQVKTTLAVPQNVQVIDNVVRWNAVDGSQGYYVLINTVEYPATDTYFNLVNASIKSGTQCQISVKTKGDGYVNLSSEYSEPISYLYIANEASDDNNSGNNNTGNNTPNSGTNEEGKKEELSNNIVDVIINSNSGYSGVGRTVNVITDAYTKMHNGALGRIRVFDSEKLASLPWQKLFIGEQTAETAKGNSMETFYTDLNVGFKTSFNTGVSIGNVFSASLTNSFGFTSDTHYENTANEIYFTSSQYYGANLIGIDQYMNIDQFANILSQQFISDILALENGNKTAKQIIDDYGTHAVLAAYYGGKVSCNLHIRNTSTKWDNSTALKYESNIQGAFSNIISAGMSTSLDVSTKLGMEKGNYEEIFKVTAIGGDSFPSSTLQDYLKNYNIWVESMNDQSIEKSVVVGFPERSLVSIWDLLPNQYTNAKAKLKTYFDATVENTNSEFLSDYERHYIEPTPDIDYGNTTEFAGGHGTIDSPYLISTSEHLRNVDKYLDKYFALKNDISINTEWIPIGQKNSSYEPFTGTFDGKGYKIIGLKRTTTPFYDSNKIARFGLFAKLDGATVKNIVFENVDINFVNKNTNINYYMKIGTLCGEANKSNISNIGVSGKIYCGDNHANSNIYVGGILGESINEVKIQYCYNKANIDVKHEVICVGGIGGYVSGNGCTVSNSYNLGNIYSFAKAITGRTSNSAGGVIGMVDGSNYVSITYCYVKCRIKATIDYAVIIGYYWWIGGILGAGTNKDQSNNLGNNYYCYVAEYHKEDKYNEEVYLLGESKKKGTEVSESTLTSGGQVGNLFVYSVTDFANNPNYCWIYQSGSLPKLYWEK